MPNRNRPSFGVLVTQKHVWFTLIGLGVLWALSAGVLDWEPLERLLDVAGRFFEKVKPW